jgi:monoamine oxidase
MPIATPPTNTLLPVQNRTHPFWLSEPDPVLATHQSSEELPETADVVIVGSGLSGAMTGYYLLKGDPSLKVVMLEAAEVCSGATARNGESH